MSYAHLFGAAYKSKTNLDWAGVLVERASGMKLNDYFQKHIFQPLGIKNINMFPTDEMKSRLAFMHQKQDGKIRTRDHLLRRALTAPNDEKDKIFNSAGAGCFARPLEYCGAWNRTQNPKLSTDSQPEILATLLNGGKSPTTSARILSSDSVDTFLTNHVPQFPDFGRQNIPAAYPQGNDPQGWNLAGMMTISPGPTGRGKNTTWWAGIANLFWWLDREKGVAGMIASQILPFGGMSCAVPCFAKWLLCGNRLLTWSRSGGARSVVRSGRRNLCCA